MPSPGEGEPSSSRPLVSKPGCLPGRLLPLPALRRGWRHPRGVHALVTLAGAAYLILLGFQTLLSLRDRYARLACLDMSGAPVQSPDFAAHDCYLFGNEARGLPREQLVTLPVQSFTIAGCGAIESLNLAATVNMCVYELNR